MVLPQLFALEIRAQCENVTSLRPASDDYTLMVKYVRRSPDLSSSP